MNIIQKRREKRKEIINRIAKGLKNSIKKYGGNLAFDFGTILIVIQSDFSCTRRTAIEYADIALYKIGLTRGNLPLKGKEYFVSLEIPKSKNEVSK